MTDRSQNGLSGLEAQLIWASLDVEAREILKPPVVLAFGAYPILVGRSSGFRGAATPPRRALHIICWSLRMAQAISRNADRICQDKYIQESFDQIILSIGNDIRHPYFKIPVFPVKELKPKPMLNSLSPDLDLDVFPTMKLSDAIRELEGFATEGRAASLVSFTDGHMMAANSLNVRMSGVELRHRLRLPNYMPWHLPGEFDRYVQEILRDKGNVNDHIYLSRKVSDNKIYRYRVRTRAVRLEGYDGELFRLAVEVTSPESME